MRSKSTDPEGMVRLFINSYFRLSVSKHVTMISRQWRRLRQRTKLIIDTEMFIRMITAEFNCKGISCSDFLVSVCYKFERY